MKKLFLILHFFIIHSLACIPVNLSFTPPFTVTGYTTSTTFFIRDFVGNEFVLKYHPRGPKRAVHDTLGAWVGQSFGLNINAVEIFSPGDPFNELFIDINPLEQSQFGVTTLHTRVPGLQVKEYKELNKAIYIKRGLYCEKNLKSLINYPQLCDMVAFDIFIENTDRHNRNIIFDKKSGIFYAIDMDHGFKSAHTLALVPRDYDFDTLAIRAYDFVKTLKKRPLSSEEIQVLRRIRYTLEKLADHYTPEVLFTEWMAIAKKADIHYSSRDKEKIKKYIEYNAQEIARLIVLVDM